MGERFDAPTFFSDFGIDHTTQHQKCTKDHVNVHCPFCVGSDNYHLGFHIIEKRSYCWRCGGHSIEEYIKVTQNCSWAQAYEIANKYDSAGSNSHYQARKQSFKTYENFQNFL